MTGSAPWTPIWIRPVSRRDAEPAVPEARDRLLLTERRHPLTKNSLTLLFKRLSQRAGFTKTPICPSRLRDTYAIRFLQAGGGLAALREQLGVADLASVKRCDTPRPLKRRGFSLGQSYT